MMDRLTGKEEAIEQFTALEPVGRMGQPEENSRRMDVLRRSLL
jgi:hypothetical protein